MYPLTRLYARKLYRQKLIYIFFACFFTASFFYAFLISTPQMEEMLNINIGIVGRKNFPEFMMRFYVGTVGILFNVFLLTLFVCEEDRNKMLYQPLLHGENRNRMIRSKIYVAVSMSMIFVLLVAFINYITAFMRWGYEIFEQAAFIRTIIKYLLSGIYMSVITLGIVALCICTRNAWKTIFFVIIYLLIDQFIYSSNIALLQKIWVGYYFNLWTFAYEYQKIPFSELLIGISIMILYGIAFFQITLYRTKKNRFLREVKMIIRLLNIQFARLKRQKILYLFFVVMAVIIISNALQEDNGMGYYAGGKFPTMCMQSYIDIVGTLFLSFISAVLICGEKASGMFRQPLLNGVSKKQLLIAKTISISTVALICFLFVVFVSIITGFFLWGSHIFDHAQEYLLQMLLLAFPQITMVLFLVLLSLYMSNISSMMCASLIILLVNNLFSQFFGSYISFVDFMYYLYVFSGYNGMELTGKMIVLGIAVNVITGIILVYGISRRTNSMIM